MLHLELAFKLIPAGPDLYAISLFNRFCILPLLKLQFLFNCVLF